VLAAGHDGAAEQEHRDLDVGVLAEFAGLDAVAQDGAHQVTPRFYHAFLVPGDEPGVALPRAVQQRVLLGVPRVVRVGGDHGEQGDQVLARRFAARPRQRAAHRGERRDQQVFLARPAPVQRGLAHPRPGGDVLAVHAVDAALADGVDGGLQDRLLGALAARAARPPRGGVPAVGRGRVAAGGGRGVIERGRVVAGLVLLDVAVPAARRAAAGGGSRGHAGVLGHGRGAPRNAGRGRDDSGVPRGGLGDHAGDVTVVSAHGGEPLLSSPLTV